MSLSLFYLPYFLSHCFQKDNDHREVNKQSPRDSKHQLHNYNHFLIQRFRERCNWGSHKEFFEDDGSLQLPAQNLQLWHLSFLPKRNCLTWDLDVLSYSYADILNLRAVGTYNSGLRPRRALFSFLKVSLESEWWQIYIVDAELEQNVDKLIVLKNSFKFDDVGVGHSSMNLDLGL